MNPPNNAIATADGENLTASSDSNEKNNKTLLTLTYGLYLAAVFLFILAFAAIIINHVKKREFSGSVYQSHLLWQIRTFWWCFFWLVSGLVISLISLFSIHIPVGFLIYICVAIWYLYRNIRGLIRLLEGRPAY